MSSNNNPRHIAATALLKVVNEGAYSNILLNNTLKESNLSGADKALCTAIFYGTLDRLITIDYYLSKLISKPLKKIKPYTLSVLRTAVYQIKYLDKIPDSAAVNEAVKLIKKSKESFNSAFVNAVLRNLLRTDIPLKNGDSLEDISVYYSCPKWIAEILLCDYGTEFTKAFLEESFKAPEIYIRVNTLKTTAEALKNRGLTLKTTDYENIFILENVSSVEALEEYKEGLFFVQDLSCQRAIQMLEIGEKGRILDMCAAPGGKSFCASQYLKEGEIISLDLYEHRANLISASAERLGIENIKAFAQDAAKYNKDLGLFDYIICDVPCSGLGVIRRKPDIKYRQSEDLNGLIEIQRAILYNAKNYLRKGGKILYSTCTLNKQENIQNVEHFLSDNKDFTLEEEYTFSPQKDGGDGFYAAILKRNEV